MISTHSAQTVQQDQGYWLEFTSGAIPPKILNSLKDAKIYKYDRSTWCLDFAQLKAGEYLKFKPLLEFMRGKWNKKTHVFPYDPTELLSLILDEGKYPKVNPGSFFPTPESTAIDLCAYIDMPERSHDDDSIYEYNVLEPSAGTGAIASVVRDRMPNAAIDCFELDPFNRGILKDQGFNLIGDDFLVEALPSKQYDYVVMNPPFEGDRYIDHILKAFDCLRMGGRLAAIVPESMLWKTSKKAVEFRNFVAEFGHWEAIGSPFEDTKIKCLQIKLERLSPENLARLWGKSNGHESYFQEEVEIALSNDRSFYEFLEGSHAKKDDADYEEFIGKQADRTMADFIGKQGYCLLWNDRVRAQVVKSLAEDIKLYY